MNSKKAVEIVILDSSKHYSEALSNVLKNYFKAVVSNASNENDLTSLLEHITPDIIIYDLFSTYKNFGFSIEAIHKSSPLSKVVVLSFESNEELIDMCIKNGASGFLNKTIIDVDLLTEYIGKIIQGEISILTQAA